MFWLRIVFPDDKAITIPIVRYGEDAVWEVIDLIERIAGFSFKENDLAYNKLTNAIHDFVSYIDMRIVVGEYTFTFLHANVRTYPEERFNNITLIDEG